MGPCFTRLRGFWLKLTRNIKQHNCELRECKGKFIVTTFSSHISRLNQVVAVTEKLGRKICFIGRSMEKTKELAVKMGYLHIKPTTEIPMEQLRNYKDHQLVLVIAGSQGQENSALSRIANNEHREVHLKADDVVVFSSDAIPGSEVSIGLLFDEIEKRGAKVIYNNHTHDYHVSGHGSDEDNKLLIALTKPKYLLPISGSYRNMTAYAGLAEDMGYDKKSVLLIEDGQEILFGRNSVRMGKKVPSLAFSFFSLGKIARIVTAAATNVPMHDPRRANGIRPGAYPGVPGQWRGGRGGMPARPGDRSRRRGQICDSRHEPLV